MNEFEIFGNFRLRTHAFDVLEVFFNDIVLIMPGTKLEFF